jgi:hypothetical protein
MRALFLTVLQDSIVASLGAWGQPLQILPGFLDQSTTLGLRLLVVILVTGGLFAVYFLRLERGARREAGESGNAGPQWGKQAMLVGLLALLVSGWPTWITALPMRMGFPLDRYALSMSVGVSLMLAGLIDWLGRDRVRKAALLALLIGLAVGFHFQTALRYDQDWTTLNNFLWQLTWRAPSVKPNTLFASVNMPFRYFEDDSLTAPLNWTYDPDSSSRQMPYLLYDLDVRNKSIPSFVPGQPVERSFRAAQFSGTTDQIVLFHYAPPGCVHVLDPRFDSEVYSLPEWLLNAMPISNPRNVISASGAPAKPPAQIFGSEPKRRWCYYYEQAELARQQGDWETIYRLGQQSIDEGFRPADPVEYLPFIEGYIHYGVPDDAYELSRYAEQDSHDLRPAICAAWMRAFRDAPDLYPGYRRRLNRSFDCRLPEQMPVYTPGK